MVENAHTISLDDLPEVVTTVQYAKVMQMTPKTLILKMRMGDRAIVEALNPNAKKGYRFSRDRIIKKVRGR